MFGRYRELVLLFSVAIVMSALISIALRPSQPHLPISDTVESADPKFQPGGAGCRPGSPAPPRDRAGADSVDCAEETERYRLQFNDLVQQTRAANAAEAQAYLAYNMSWMVLIGTAGGILTLAAALAAALYAREAARAATDSLRHATEATDDQLRPWLQLEIEPALFRLDETNASAGYFVRLKNLGRLPATNVYWDAEIYDLKSDREAIEDHFRSRLVPRASWIPRTILPQGQIEMRERASTRRDKLSVTESDGDAQIHPILAVRIVYEWRGGGEGCTCQSFEILRHRKADEDHHESFSINLGGKTERKFEVKQAEFDRIW